MSKYSVIFLVLTALWLFLGIKTMLYDRRNKSYLLFAILCLTMIIWTFFLGIGYSLDDTERIELLLKIAYIGGFLFSPVNLHFFLEISKSKLKPVYLVLSYLPFIALLISNFFGFFVFSRYVKYDDEWFGILDSGSMRVRLYIIVVLLTFIVSFLTVLKWNRRTKLNKEKIQSRLILVFTPRRISPPLS